MSRKDFKRIRVVGDVLEAMQKLEKVIGEPPTLHLSEKGLAKWKALEKEYDDFYKLDIQDRLIYSGYATPKAQLASEEER